MFIWLSFLNFYLSRIKWNYYNKCCWSECLWFEQLLLHYFWTSIQSKIFHCQQTPFGMFILYFCRLHVIHTVKVVLKINFFSWLINFQFIWNCFCCFVNSLYSIGPVSGDFSIIAFILKGPWGLCYNFWRCLRKCIFDLVFVTFLILVLLPTSSNFAIGPF